MWDLCEPRKTPPLLRQVPEALLPGLPQPSFDQKEQVPELSVHRPTDQTASQEYPTIIKQGTNILQELGYWLRRSFRL